MTNERLYSALCDCMGVLADKGHQPRRDNILPPGDYPFSERAPHLGDRALGLASTAALWYRSNQRGRGGGEFYDRQTHKDRREKAMRWLGYVQGTCVALGYLTIEDIKRQSMPVGEKYREDDG